MRQNMDTLVTILPYIAGICFGTFIGWRVSKDEGPKDVRFNPITCGIVAGIIFAFFFGIILFWLVDAL
jgi:hypothetical protein